MNLAARGPGPPPLPCIAIAHWIHKYRMVHPSVHDADEGSIPTSTSSGSTLQGARCLLISDNYMPLIKS